MSVVNPTADQEFRDDDTEFSNHPIEVVANPTRDATGTIGGHGTRWKEEEEDPPKKDWKAEVAAGFTSLKNSPPELYKIYAVKFLDSYSYFSFSIIFTLFLSDDFGYSDVEAGFVYGVWGSLITVYGFGTGFLVDNFGVAKSLRLGYGVRLLAQCGIFLATSREMLLFHIYGTLPLGICMGIPVLMTGIRRYTHEKNRGFAFGIFYVVMNVAALIAGPVVDVLTIWYKGGEEGDDHDGETATVPHDGSWSLSSYRAIVLSGIVSTFVACCISFTVREIKVESTATVSSAHRSAALGTNNSNNNNSNATDEVGPYDTNGHPTAVRNGNGLPSTASARGGGVAVFRPKTGSPYQIFKEITKSPSFRRFLLVVLILLNVRQVFRHLDATWPKYMIREFGPDVPKGTIYSINPVIIIVLVPIVSAMTAHIDPLDMIHFGSYISAASVFFLAFSTSIWSSCVFMVLLSLGEAIWSPRLNDYTVSVSEEGREGTYQALASAPLFLAKLPVGVLGGFLLERYCPETLEDGQERHSKTMWLIVGVMTATSPVLLTCCWGYVSKKEVPSDAEFLDGVKYTELRTTSSRTELRTIQSPAAESP